MPFGFTLELHHDEIAALLKGAEVMADMERRANNIAQEAGSVPDEFDVNVQVGATRARASVFTSSPDGMLLEANDRALTRAIDAGRQ